MPIKLTNFKMIRSVVLQALGLSNLAGSDDKLVLTPEQRDIISHKFGSDFTESFCSALQSDGEDTPKALAGVVTAVENAIPDAVAAVNTQLQEALARESALKTDLANSQSIISALSAKPEDDLVPEGVSATGVHTTTGFRINTSASHYQFATQGLSGNFQAATPNTIDVADLRKELGVYMPGNNLEIYKKMFGGVTSLQYMRSVHAPFLYKASTASIRSVVQQFNSKWTSAGKVKFTPFEIRTYRHKINFSIIPADVADSWMYKLYSENLSPEQMPITKYIINELLIPQVAEDIEYRMLGKGEYVERNADEIIAGNAISNPEDSMDGFETILVKALKAKGTAEDKNVNFVTAIDWDKATDQEVLDFFDRFVRSISPLLRNRPMNIYCSYDVRRRYKQAYKNVWGTGGGVSDPDFGGDRIDYSVNTLVVLDSMFASPIVFATPVDNFIRTHDMNQVGAIINDIQKHDYEVRIYGEFKLGVGFAIGEAVFAAVPENYNPKATIESALGKAEDLNWGMKNGVAKFDAAIPDQGGL